MSMSTRHFPALSPGILFAATPVGGVVYDVVDESLVFLNPSGAALCDACRIGSNLATTIDEWATAGAVPVSRVRSDVAQALDQFRTSGFIDRDVPLPTTYPPVAPVGSVRDGESSTVQAAGVHRIRFRSVDAALVRAVADLLGLEGHGSPTAEFRIVPDVDGSIRLFTDTEWRFGDRDDLLARVVMVVNDFVARTTTDGVVHAAALRSPKGATVVFPAASGSGKSTLAARLLLHGWAYAADESVTARSTDGWVVPCAKPIELDGASCTALGIDPTKAGAVPVTTIAADPVVVRDPIECPQWIVAPRYVGPAGASVVRRLEFSEALVMLVGSCLNLRYVGSDGLETLVGWATTAEAYEIAYRDGDEAVDQLARLGT